MPKQKISPGPILLVIALAVYGVTSAVDLRWVCDDAFISFRYAKNLVDGFGLVFNAGEYVEGYTNFLWTLLIALGMKFGADPVLFSETLGIIFYLATGALLLRFSSYVNTSGKTRGFVLPLAAIAYFLHHDLQVWATSGLETSLVTFLITAGFLGLTTVATNSGRLATGGLFCLAALTRPDALIIYIAALLFLALWERNLKNVALTALPALLILAPHWLWRFSYYGHLLPNTYYAKSVDLSWWGQGSSYVWLYLKSYYAFIITIPLSLLAVYELSRKLFSKQANLKGEDDTIQKALVGALAMAAAYTLSVMRVGGDFMFARLLIPITPLLLIAVESAQVLYVKRQPLKVMTGVVFATAILLNVNLFSGLGQIDYIADESKYYPPERHDEEKRIGEMLKPIFAETGAKIGFYGMRATMVYYANPALAVECQTGLTDEFIAHLPLERRGRPGHEKEAPEEYLYQRKLHFILKTVYDFTLPQDRLRALHINDYTTYILTYDNQVMDQLQNIPGCSFINFPHYLDNYITNLPNLTAERVARDFQMFKRYYFDINNDSARLEPFINKFSPLTGE